MKYPYEYKRTAVIYYHDHHDLGFSRCAKRFGITGTTLKQWVTAFPNVGPSELHTLTVKLAEAEQKIASYETLLTRQMKKLDQYATQSHYIRKHLEYIQASLREISLLNDGIISPLRSKDKRFISLGTLCPTEEAIDTNAIAIPVPEPDEWYISAEKTPTTNTIPVEDALFTVKEMKNTYETQKYNL
ncbi:hypothetical protein [Veillonella magna]|uniref:Transposase n=1 Tax=Veillonella magna TaxID=464322 RepID=A0ABS2GCM1_9FIRM|nr:hypothetical protein [Veillonella magna]MBM6823550.1 hypothetical protein [Veillonella magna]MBM6911894.1 hypothetical protein [Veillonella magna]